MYRDTAAFPVTTDKQTTCSVVEHELYCWGRNDYAQLGRGNKDPMYQVPDSPVNLGRGFEVDNAKCGQEYCCAVSTAEDLKCLVCAQSDCCLSVTCSFHLCIGWGRHFRFSDTGNSADYIGDVPGEMGDALPVLFKKVKQYVTTGLSVFVMHEVNSETKISSVGLRYCRGEPMFEQCNGGYYGASDPFEVILEDNFVPALIGGGESDFCVMSDSNEIQC